MDSKVVFGSNLRRLIKQSGYKYQSAAEKIGISLSFLNQLMNGESAPSIDTIQKICDKLNFKKSDLFSEEYEPATAQTKIGEMTALQFQTFFDDAMKKTVKAMDAREELTPKKQNVLRLLDSLKDERIYDAIEYFAVVNPQRLFDLVRESNVSDEALQSVAAGIAHKHRASESGQQQSKTKKHGTGEP